MFELHIECTKDIDKLKIDFSDGSSVVQSKPKESNGDSKKESNIETQEAFSSPRKKEDALDTEADFGGISQEVVKPPQIDREERGVYVADELQNFDF